MFKNVLLCYDGSDAGRRALKRGAELAILVGAQVYVLSIVPDDALSPAILATASGHLCLVNEELNCKTLLNESIELLNARGVTAKGYLAHGNPIEQIVAYSKKLNADLIVLSHYPRLHTIMSILGHSSARCRSCMRRSAIAKSFVTIKRCWRPGRRSPAAALRQ